MSFVVQYDVIAEYGTVRGSLRRAEADVEHVSLLIIVDVQILYLGHGQHFGQIAPLFLIR